MKKEVVDHLTSVVISSILKHGNSYMDHIPEMFENWKGPLEDNNVFLYRSLIRNVGKKNVEIVMGKLSDLVLHPLFGRDFFQGVIEGLGNPVEDKRIDFYGRPSLKLFLESKDHPFNIQFGSSSISRNRTKRLPFLSLVCKGELDRYFAGALSSSVPFHKGDEVFCRISNKCAGILRKLGIRYLEYEDSVLITPFYLMIFCGDLPLQIFEDWMVLLSDKRFAKMESASIDALMNWRYVFGSKYFSTDYLPYLRSRSYYYFSMGITMEKLDKIIVEKQFDFVDERVRNRVERWYNTCISTSGPIFSPESA